jgi:hypothetical protein
MPSVILSVSVGAIIDGICDVCDNLYRTSKTPRIPTAPRSRIGLAMAMVATGPQRKLDH